MKREIIFLMLLALLLTGCGGAEDPYRVDTVVRIPVDPTDAPMETVTEPTEAAETEPEETEAPTETVPEVTEETKKQSTGSTKSSSTKSSGTKSSSTKSSGTTSGKNDSNNATEPPKETDPPKTTEPAATKPPETEPVETEAPATDPPATEPAETEAPATDPPATEPAETEAPATEPPATEPPATEPPETEPELYDISGYSVGSLEYAMLDQINAARSEEGLGDLSLSSRLSAIASCRGYEICQVWSHTRPDGRGYASVLSDYGYGAGTVTELLVYVSGSGDAASIVDKWMSPDSHKGSLLSDSYTTVGIGVYHANGFTYVCCLMVG